MSKEFEFDPDNIEKGIKIPSEQDSGSDGLQSEPNNIDEINPNIDIITKPVVILFGPKQVGKTMVLMRLLKYFDKLGKTTFQINDQFITEPYFDGVKRRFMTDFRKQNEMANATAGFNFLLLDVIQGSEPFCHILEAPGEHFFDLKDLYRTGFNNYLSRLINSLNQKKVFVVFFEDAFLNSDEVRAAYAQRVASVLKQLTKNDSVLFLFNKVDQSPNLSVGGEIKSNVLKNKIFDNQSYSPIKNALKENRNIKSVGFVPFSSGTAGQDSTFAFGNDKYPERLWRSIVNAITPKGCLWW